jgi:hypothetical protein
MKLKLFVSLQVRSAFNYPMESKRVGMYIAEGVSTFNETHRIVSDFRAKCIGFHLENVVDHPTIISNKSKVVEEDDEEDELDNTYDDEEESAADKRLSPLTRLGKWYISEMLHCII